MSTEAVNIISVGLVQATRKFRVPTRYKIEGHVGSARIKWKFIPRPLASTRVVVVVDVVAFHIHVLVVVHDDDGETQTSSCWLTVKFVKNSRNNVGAKFCDAAAADADRRQTAVDLLFSYAWKRD